LILITPAKASINPSTPTRKKGSFQKGEHRYFWNRVRVGA